MSGGIRVKAGEREREEARSIRKVMMCGGVRCGEGGEERRRGEDNVYVHILVHGFTVNGRHHGGACLIKNQRDAIVLRADGYGPECFVCGYRLPSFLHFLPPPPPLTSALPDLQFRGSRRDTRINSI